MPTTIRVSADHVTDGVVTQSGCGEIAVSVVGDRIVLVPDAIWECDRFSMTPDDAWRLGKAICDAAKAIEGTL